MDRPMIFGKIAAILAELPAIGKNQRNQQQGFNFRGIDDVLNALNPVLAKHGVFYVPDVIKRVAETRQTQRGGAMNVVHLHVRYTFHAEDGSSVSGSAWGEGTDSGDKATSKAMTMAMKYVLFQVFAIAAEEQSQVDADRSGEAAAPVEHYATEAQQDRVRALLDTLEATGSDERLKKVLDAFAAKGLDPAHLELVPRATAARLVPYLENQIKQATEAPEPAGAPRSGE